MFRSFISCSREPLTGFGSTADVSVVESNVARPRGRAETRGEARGARCVSLDNKTMVRWAQSQLAAYLHILLAAGLLWCARWIFPQIQTSRFISQQFLFYLFLFYCCRLVWIGKMEKIFDEKRQCLVSFLCRSMKIYYLSQNHILYSKNLCQFQEYLMPSIL